jgi:hypothetical protein
MATVLSIGTVYLRTERANGGEYMRRIEIFTAIFGPKRDGVTGRWRKLHNEELHNLYSSPSVITIIKVEEDEMGGTCGTNGGEEVCV